MDLQKTVTPKKLQANRQNALRSSGPRTQAGKERARYNAVKHGLLSADVVIKAGVLEEDENEYAALLQEMADCYRPVGVVEELLTKEITDCQWRIRRILRCEVAEIRRQAIPEPTEDRRQWQRTLERGLALSTQNRAIEINSLQRAIAEISEEKPLSVESKEFFAKYSLTLAPAASEYDKAVRDRTDVSLLGRMGFLGLLNNDLSALEAAGHFGKAPLREEDYDDYEARTDSKTLPEGKALDKILRYEGAMKRHLYRAMHQLERVQRQRQGEFLPSPIAVTL
jgi:hypothetical protein